MKKILLIAVVIFSQSLRAQTLYVNALNGNDNAAGTARAPLASLQQAVGLAKGFSGSQPVTIIVAPGLYVLKAPLKLETRHGGSHAAAYTLEALVMPDDPAWNPYKMPVIASSDTDNDNNRQIPHCAGILVERSNVLIRGLKFTGNPNPSVYYYSPIVRDSLALDKLEVSQCYFTGDRYSAPIQGAVYVNGPDVQVDHCIFYGCGNAVLALEKMKDLSVEHCIVYGAYECAFWYGAHGEPDQPFTFAHNIVSRCRCCWHALSDLPLGQVSNHFDHCLICQNDGYAETDNPKALAKIRQALMQNELQPPGPRFEKTDSLYAPVPVKLPYPENDVRKTGHVSLDNYLNLAPGSDGADLGAGIF